VVWFSYSEHTGLVSCCLFRRYARVVCSLESSYREVAK